MNVAGSAAAAISHGAKQDRQVETEMSDERAGAPAALGEALK